MLTEAGKTTYQDVQTPSGIEIRYHWEPVRKYEARYPIGHDSSDEEWREVPSVTTVLDVLHKDGLPWWGQEKGIEGMLQLQHYPEVSWDSLKDASAEGVVSLLKKHKLSINHVRDQASSRGHSVHAALEGWAKDRVVPDPSIFPAEEKPYVQGLATFLVDIEGAVDNLECEVIVGSLEHGFAGRYDLCFDLTEPRDVAYKHTPVRGAKYATLQPGRYMLDLKTSKRVYNSHYRQLAGYELASRECGYEPTDAQGILHVMDNGGYEFVRSVAQPDDFLISLSLWKSEAQIKQRLKENK